MGFWRVLGGVASGIGAIALLPVLAPVGVITATGAVVGGTIGAIGGAVASSMDEDSKTEARNSGYEKGKAEGAIGIEKLTILLKKAEERFNGYKEYENLFVAMFAVGISVANSDGEIKTTEKEDIEAFISGAAYKRLPDEVRRVIEKLYGNPPSFNDAMKYVNQVDRADWEIFDIVIEIVINSDGAVKGGERGFREAWRRYKAS